MIYRLEVGFKPHLRDPRGEKIRKRVLDYLNILKEV